MLTPARSIVGIPYLQLDLRGASFETRASGAPQDGGVSSRHQQSSLTVKRLCTTIGNQRNGSSPALRGRWRAKASRRGQSDAHSSPWVIVTTLRVFQRALACPLHHALHGPPPPLRRGGALSTRRLR